MAKHVALPLSEDAVGQLHAGDSVLLSGVMYVARDAAHRRMKELLDNNEPLPFDITGQTVYYMGPTPAPPGRVIGAAGPTTSGRMDKYAPLLIENGLRGMVGKGMRSKAVKDAVVRYKAVYCAAVGGAGALLSQRIIEAEVIAWDDLGAEAVRRIHVKDFPVVVINDIYGGDLYAEGKEAWKKVEK
jgi:fumarate hydratase subunit beta